MKIKWLLFTVFFGCLLTAYFILRPHSKDKESSPAITTSEVSTETSSTHTQAFIKSPLSNNSDVSPQESEQISDEERFNQALLELKSEENQKISLIDGAGYSEEGAKAMIENRSISIEDSPEPIRSLQRKDLENLKKNGYQTLSEEDINQVLNIENSLAGKSSDEIENLSFKPSKLPEILSSKYSYAGYAYDPSSNIEKGGLPSDSLRRVFKKMDSNTTIIVEEASRANLASTLTKEFVNTNIDGNDATYEVKKSPSGKSYTSLIWSGKNYVYTLYQSGNPISKEQLLELGNQLDLQNNQ